MLVEKRVAGIIRWLERLKQSYSSGAIESALMDAECARADLENLRRDVWAKVRPSAKHESTIFSRALNSARTFSLAVIIVMMSVVPLSREIHVPVIEQVRHEQPKTQPIIVVREHEAPKTAINADKNEARKQASSKRSAPKRSQAAKTQTQSSVKAAKTVEPLPYDKVYSLIQTGQRALKNNSTIIKIQ